MNKIDFKKLLIKISIITCIILSIFIVTTIIEYRIYNMNYNTKINSILSTVKERYPDISENELIEILTTNDDNNILDKYNLDKYATIINTNKYYYKLFLLIDIILLFICILSLLIVFIKYNKKKDKELESITNLIKEINNKNYELKIDDNSEDDLSILKNEIYKTTIMLKETAENSKLEKLELKSSLEDISHQLKTPLTSILIILDNLIEDPNMDESVRKDFLVSIKKEIDNINFLVQNLLKLSKLDTNTVKFNNKKINLRDVVNRSIDKLSCLADLKNIDIIIKKDDNVFVKTDIIWQVEAISNILKNSIEHSNMNSKIDISINNKKVYKELIIKDYGVGMDSYDLKHIFERFYKGKNASNDSIGIGLALSKSIIEKSNGKILVDSTINKGTTFTIRYY